MIFVFIVAVDKQELTRITSLLKRTYVELDDGWITPFNGFKYKKFNTSNTWPKCREFCQSLGGDLVVYGIRDSAVKK